MVEDEPYGKRSRIMFVVKRRGIYVGLLVLVLAPAVALGLVAGAEPGLAQPPIRIGLIDTYTGPVALGFADPAKYSWEMVVDEFNAKGGLNGRKIELLTCDDRYSPKAGVACAEELAKKGVDFFAGTSMTDVGLAISEWARRNKRLYIAHVCASHQLTEDFGHRYCFHTQQNVAMVARAGARYAYYRRFKKWYILDENNPFGKHLARIFWDRLKELIPDAVRMKASTFERGTTNFGPYIEDILQVKPVAVLAAVSPKGMIAFVRQANKAGLFSKTHVIMPAMADPIFSFILKDDMPSGKAYGETAYLYYWPDTPENREFVEKWTKFAKSRGASEAMPPGLGAFGGYCAAKFLTEAILKAGSTDTEKVIDALEGLTIRGPRGPVTLRACDHQMITSSIWGRLDKVPGHRWPILASPYTVDPKMQEQLMGSCEEVLATRRPRE
ncbi:ABC transporter substrate-binding protein [Thermodesulfobacteriota bacterium]